MGDLSMGSNWLQGPWYASPLSTPLSRLPFSSIGPPAYRAFTGGYAVGTFLDKQFGLSDKLSSYAADRTPSPVKWWIHDHF